MRHNRSVVDVLFVFIPQVFFLSCIFVYLCVMVVLKWIFFYVNPTFIFGQLYPGSNCAPSLLIGLINMFMLKARDVSNQFTRTDLLCYFSGFHKSHRLLKGFVKQLTSCVTSTVFSREH
ncbi:unnamed protein product [Heligmosomoides polygyrus]|uniref:V-type proton ATPase subunit a n=1 Tax=Heligmosomoides polygyrus TaxID=6339 RepID=A0A183F9T2_HELPZ|nr:unnamed protein product [Heligmosomoides polygyrus]